VTPLRQRPAQFFHRGIWHIVDELLDQHRLRLDPAGATVTAEWTRSAIAARATATATG
jgi:hypothetical protein